MPEKLNVSIIHGIGNSQPGYSKPLADGITRAFSNEVNQILSTTDNYSNQLLIQETVWKSILNNRQQQLGHLHDQFYFSNFFSFGSQISIFALRYKNDLFRHSPALEDPAGR